VSGSSVIIINCCSIIIKAYFNDTCIINPLCFYLYFISNEGDEEEDLQVTWAAITPCLTRIFTVAIVDFALGRHGEI